MTNRQITHSQPGSWCAVENSAVSPFNCDATRLLLQHSGGSWGLYDGDGVFLRTIDLIVHNDEPRWSRTDPNVFYFISARQLIEVDFSSGRSKVLHTFNEYIAYTEDGRNGVSGKGEADISLDGDHLVLCGTKPDGSQKIFVYEISTGQKLNVFGWGGGFDGLKISADNQAIVSDEQGIWVIDPAVMGGRRQITQFNGHSCLVRYQGRDKLLWCSNADPVNWKNAVVMIDVLDPSDRTTLLDFGKDPVAFHISAPANKDWCIVSTYGANEPDGKIYQVWFDTSVKRLADGINSNVTSYLAQPKASVSRDGRKIVYNRETDGVVDAWMIDLDEKPVSEKVAPSSKYPGMKELGFTDGYWVIELIVKNGVKTFRMWAKE